MYKESLILEAMQLHCSVFSGIKDRILVIRKVKGLIWNLERDMGKAK